MGQHFGDSIAATVYDVCGCLCVGRQTTMVDRQFSIVFYVNLLLMTFRRDLDNRNWPRRSPHVTDDVRH